MKWIAGSTAVLLAAAAYALVGIRPFRTPCAAVDSSVGARSYWVEDKGDGEARIRHVWGASWPIERYGGEAGRLWLAQPPGLGKTFLVLDTSYDAYTLRRAVWHVRSPFDLLLVADVFTVGDETWDLKDSKACERVFHDVDGDGLEEIAASSRDWIFDEKGELIDNWAVRTIHLGWTGDRFEPRWSRLWALGQEGPLVGSDDPRSTDGKAAGLAR